MQNHFPTWRALAASLVAVIAYVLLSATAADAQVGISKTDINIENTGTGDANTGRNALVANDSINVATSTQTVTEEDGTVTQNVGEAVNESEGEASLETGNATAVGNAAKTAVIQATASGSEADALIAAAVGTPYGPAPISPLAPSDEAPTAEDTSEEESTGSAPDLETDEEGEAPDTEAPVDSTAATEGTATGGTGGQQTPASALPNSGSAAADAGTPDVPALATTPLDNTVLGAVSGAGPPGITETDQNTDVDNQGDARANSGENTVVDGDVLTGTATATGNISETMTSQLISALGDLNLVDQDIDVDNEGDARANTGRNIVEGGDLETGDATALGNQADNATSQIALAAGDLNLVDQETDVSNEGDARANTGRNVTDGDVVTGSATATGNRAHTETSQFAVATGGLNQVDQAIDVSNEGEARARTGENIVSGGDLETGDADAAGSISATAAFQFVMAAGDQNLVDQAIDADNEGDAVAETGENVVEDGEVATGDATATGNWSGTALGQRVITPASEESTDIEQAIAGENVGDALADTGDNLAVAGEDGEATILTGDALAIGNRSALAASQDA
ncbi:MAG: hypothetical protein QOG87_1627 [Actinomycetota bacterium]|jgi:hypothetical protein